MQSSYFRGHPTIWIDKPYVETVETITGEIIQQEVQGYWVYKDTQEFLPSRGGIARPCKKCGKQTPLGEGEVDPCLSVLPGVDNACCGHGVRENSYIRFTNGVIVEGFTVGYTERWEAKE